MLRTAVQTGETLTCFLIDVPAKLRCDHHFVSEGCDTFPKYSFHLVRTVSLGRIVKGNTMIESCPDNVEHFGPGWYCRLISTTHILNTKANAGNFQVAKFTSFPNRACQT